MDKEFRMKRALITGITGQDGAYLAKLLLREGYKVYGLVSRRVNQNFDNLEYFGILEQVEIIYGDLTDPSSLMTALTISGPDEVYNLAAMSFVGLSWDNPTLTMNVNAMGAINVLEAVRMWDPSTKIYQASTSEMFGNNINENGYQNEMTRFTPRSPYGYAKLCAHNAVINHRESHDMYACNGILFNHESPIRGKEFVTRKVTDGVAQIVTGKSKGIVLGDMSAKRDWGFAGDYVEAMWLMLQQDHPDDFVISTGQTWSIEQLVDTAFSYEGMRWQDYVLTSDELKRPAELYTLKGDASKAKEKLGWKPEVSFVNLIQMMVDADIKRHENK